MVRSRVVVIALLGAGALGLGAATRAEPSDARHTAAAARPSHESERDADAGPICTPDVARGCPLFRRMVDKTARLLASGDALAVAKELDAIAELGPKELAAWRSISRDGAQAARDGKLAAVRAACSSCHRQYRAIYIRDHRSRVFAP